MVVLHTMPIKKMQAHMSQYLKPNDRGMKGYCSRLNTTQAINTAVTTIPKKVGTKTPADIL
jgi:hypothetical protein